MFLASCTTVILHMKNDFKKQKLFIFGFVRRRDLFCFFAGFCFKLPFPLFCFFSYFNFQVRNYFLSTDRLFDEKIENI